MKQLNRHIFFALCTLHVALCTVSCQLIPEADRLIPVEQQSCVSRALLTEFTGFLCVNCPDAATVAHELQQTYPDTLVVVAMHPASNPFCQTTIAKYDLTCPEADIYYKAMGGTSSTAFPTGVVNFTSGLSSRSTWPSLVRTAVHTSRLGHLALYTEVKDAAKREVKVSYQVSATSSDEALTEKSVSLQLLLWLVEDSIVAPQLMPDGSRNMEYVHNHVLRGSVFQDAWGKTDEYSINGAQAAALNEVCYTVADSINGQAIRLPKCSVVGVLMDPETHQVHDVAQVAL